MPPCELVVIADGRQRPDLPEIIAGLPVRIVDWHDTDGLSSIGDAPTLVDVDLLDSFKAKQIKDNLSNQIGSRCRIIAVNRRSHLCRVRAKGLGASELLTRPLNIHELTARLRDHFTHGRAGRGVPSGTDRQALKSEPGSASIASAAVALDHIFTALTCRRPLELASVARSGDQVIDAIADVGIAKWLDMVRRYHEGTFQHCLIVTGVLTAFGNRNGMRKSDVLTLTIAGLLHDIGKAQVPVDVLDKPGKLTNEEFEMIQRHPLVGYDYLRAQNIVGSETLRAVRHHHEYLDGSGYPDGLSAQQIDDFTRIVTVCDVYGALVEQRAYRAPNSPEMALNTLNDMARNGKVEYDLVRALKYAVSA